MKSQERLQREGHISALVHRIGSLLCEKALLSSKCFLLAVIRLTSVHPIAGQLEDLEYYSPAGEEQEPLEPCGAADPCSMASPPLEASLEAQASCLEPGSAIDSPGEGSGKHSEASPSPRGIASTDSHAEESSGIAPTAGGLRQPAIARALNVSKTWI